ncbi:hydrophobic surface binding protein A-domain-containing protein [Annulohypoxylon maeteangense]|uniref:hydrophobic surface binding protein A-domain-containing protein n=1 Tax=Annulohypoxylon maeteangense TaxID=1927788 RepID=UPI002007FAF5|nr:hydrophobic surface binding protein A-domain-containing protein [Annulohypoxylon maeteangense]KAI0883127.1 hydrophobic surface binding protein A-domain-containing protein [Annulohypoxylon maeteangense]
MKTSTFFTVAVAVAGVSADIVPAQPPTKVQRDLATVTSVVSQVSAAITKLDTSVKSFDGSDLSGVQTNAQALISALTSGASTLGSSGSISLSDALSLQSVVTPLGTVAQTLVDDVIAKKDKFQQAAACSTVGTQISNAGTAAKSLVDGVVAQVPEAAQSIAESVASKIVDTLTNLTSEFSSDKCKNSGSSASSATVSSRTTAVALKESSAAVVASTTAKELATNSAVTVTVTAPCVCSGSTTSSAVVIRTSSAPVFPANSTTVFLTGTGAKSTPASATQSIVTAGAIAHGAASGSMGFVAAVAAVLFI